MTNEDLRKKCMEFLLTQDDVKKNETYGTSRDEAEGVLAGFLEFIGAPPMVEPTPLEVARSKTHEAYWAWKTSGAELEAMERALRKQGEK